MGDLYGLIEEAGWLEIDRGRWHDLETGDLSLQDALRGPPAQLYGWGEDPPLRLLELMLDGEITDERREALRAMFDIAGLYAAAGLHDKLVFWTEADRLAAWARLDEIEAGPALYPEPLCCRPELARWACHTTGNLVLDKVNKADFGFQDIWTWAGLPDLRQCWQQARPAIDQLRRLREWYEADAGWVDITDCLWDIASLLADS
jgi:hypothetical protein